MVPNSMVQDTRPLTSRVLCAVGVSVPWLANAEVLVIAFGTARDIGVARAVMALALLMALLVPALGVWCVRRGRIGLGVALLLVGFGLSVSLLYWLNSPAGRVLQWGSLGLSWAMLLIATVDIPAGA